MPMKDFILWLVLTHIGRLLLGAFILTLGALFYNYTENLIPLYFGITIFTAQCVIMFIIMFIEIFNGGER